MTRTQAIWSRFLRNSSARNKTNFVWDTPKDCLIVRSVLLLDELFILIDHPSARMTRRSLTTDFHLEQLQVPFRGIIKLRKQIKYS